MPQAPMIKVSRASSIQAEWLSRRRTPTLSPDPQLEERARRIVEEVKRKGEASILEFSKRFDGVELTAGKLLVNKDDFKKAYDRVSKEQLDAIDFSRRRVGRLERRRLRAMSFRFKGWGVDITSTFQPIPSVGCYIPGGRASYPSTLVMTATPAKVAGVRRVVVCSPPRSDGEIDPLTLVAADICGVDEVYRIGGAQAIAALAYGVKGVEPVTKIVGPGSPIVTAAKLLVSRHVAIDVPAGPSEIVVLADETANARLVALDMISQTEHGVDSVAGLVTTSEVLAGSVVDQLSKLINDSPRGETVAASLSQNGFIAICDSLEQAVEFVNDYAPEHLEIVTHEPEEIARKILSAGLILLGPYAPVAASDYAMGTNHVLPTGGFGHAYSGLSVFDFVRRFNIVKCSKGGLRKIMRTVEVLAESEGFTNHSRTVRGRFDTV